MNRSRGEAVTAGAGAHGPQASAFRDEALATARPCAPRFVAGQVAGSRGAERRGSLPRRLDDPAGGAGQPQDVHSGVGPVDDVDEPRSSTSTLFVWVATLHRSWPPTVTQR
jgi:hypothetical protein